MKWYGKEYHVGSSVDIHLSRLTLCNRLMQVYCNKSVQSCLSTCRVKWLCVTVHHLCLITKSKLDSKDLALTKASVVISPSWTSWTFNFLSCSTAIICYPNAKSDYLSLKCNHLAIVEANCWFIYIYALPSQQKTNITKCLSGKTKLNCLMTIKHYWMWVIYLAEFTLKEDIASRSEERRVGKEC